MNCNKIKIHLSAYADAELKGKLLDSVEEHIKKCPACAEILEDYRKINNIFKEHPAAETPSHFENSVLMRLRTKKDKKTFPVFRLAFASAFVLFAIFLAKSYKKNRNDAPASGLVISDTEIAEYEAEALDIFYGGTL